MMEAHRFTSGFECPAVQGDRRGSHRFRTVYRVAKVQRDDDVGLWRVRNISDHGMMLATSVPVAAPERLQVALSEHCWLPARVAWAEADCCGVALEQPVDACGLLRRLAEERQKAGYRSPRLPLHTRALVSGEHGVTTVRLSDLSQCGVGFCHDGRFHAGMALKLLLGGGIERQGIVRWADDGRAGLLLTQPLACTDLESVRRLQSLA